MTLATCGQCGIDHLFTQCPRKSPNAQLTVLEKSQRFPSLNAIMRLHTEAKPIIEVKDTSDAKSTKMIKKKSKKKKSKMGKKRVVGTKNDSVTIKEINDESLLSECSQNPPKVVHKQAPKVLQKVVGNQVTKASPKVVDISAPKAPSRNKVNTHKHGVYLASKVETQVQNKAINLGKATQVAKHSTIQSVRQSQTTFYKPPQARKTLQISSVISDNSEEEHDVQFQRWCNGMLENTKLTNTTNIEVRKHDLDDWQTYVFILKFLAFPILQPPTSLIRVLMVHFASHGNSQDHLVGQVP